MKNPSNEKHKRNKNDDCYPSVINFFVPNSPRMTHAYSRRVNIALRMREGQSIYFFLLGVLVFMAMLPMREGDQCYPFYLHCLF